MYHLSLIKNITFEHKAYCVMKTHSTAFMEFSPKSKSQGKNCRATVVATVATRDPHESHYPSRSNGLMQLWYDNTVAP